MNQPEETTRKIDPSFWLSLLFCIVIAIGVITANEWRWDTRLFPWVVGIPALALALWQLAIDFRGEKTRADSEEGGAPRVVVDVPVDETIPEAVRTQRTLRALAWIFGFVLGIWLLGFLATIPLFVFLYLKLEARAMVLTAILLALAAELFIWGVFEAIMHLAWPEPVLLRLFR